MRNSLLTLLSVITFSFAGYSQMVGGQIFLQGLYSEVGISACGVYGAQTPPAGYNANMGTALGFVADHEQDGWNTSSGAGQPVRCGDYFYPGSPYEAWGLEINGVVYANYNSFGSCDGSVGGGIPGAVTFYGNSGNTSQGQWEGDLINGTTNLHICQYTVVPDSELYFSTTITLKNNGATPLPNVYYLRHLDPDNEQVYSFSFNTDNTVMQNPSGGSNNALCTAIGQDYGCYLGMLSTGYPDARAFIGGNVGSFPISIADTWNGNVGAGFNTAVGSTNGGFDDCMGITHYWNTIAPGQSVTFKFYYVLDPSAISNAINSTQDIEVYVNGVLCTIQGGVSSGVGSCAPALTMDTVKLRGMFCADDSVLVDINSTVPYTWTWPSNPDITVLDPSGDSALVIPTAIIDSVTYTLNGMYTSGVDTSLVVLYLTLVEEDPVADFVYELGCLDKPTCFNDTSSTNSGSTISSYLWDFDEAPLIGHSPDTCVLLQNYAVHNVQLIIETTRGCKDTIIKPVNVLDSIHADFSYLPACMDSNTYFFDETIYTDTNIVSWVWDFGTVPASGSVLTNPSHIYTAVANYDVSLILTNAIGCKDTVVKEIAVNPSPTVNFSATPLAGCAPLVVDFNDLSTGDTTDIVAWLWEFGTGDTSSAQNPTYTYTDGLDNTFLFYDVTLTVTTEYGCQATATVNDYITVAPYPEAEFTINITDPSPLVGHVIQFVDLSVANINTWIWDFGDGSGSNVQYPSHIYDYPDTFTVTLIVFNTSGCSDTIQHTYIVTEEYGCHIPNSFTPNDNGLNEMFMAYGTGITEFKMTIFDRWGKEIFVSDDMAKGWNGRQSNGSGELYKMGVYAYRVEIVDQLGKSHTILGHVNLIR
jgi:gliding motility-associated-like protein